MMRVYLVNTAESLPIPDHEHDAPINLRGVAQARLVGERLAQRLRHISSVIRTTGEVRVLETSNVVRQTLESRTSLTWPEMQECPSTETLQIHIDRLRYQNHQHAHDILVFTNANAMLGIVGNLLNIPAVRLSRAVDIEPTAVTELQYDGPGWSLQRLNDAGHLVHCAWERSHA